MVMEIVITDENYSEYASQNKPMMIDFSATWCGPCKKMAPIIEELGKKYDGRIIVGKVDVDENPEITSQFGIRNIPTILFFKDGQVVDKTVGAIPANDVEAKMEKLL
ncbi:MAG: thioredoxin [Bacteroidaceae bacterium]